MEPLASGRSFPTCQQVCAYAAITALAIAAITIGVQQIPTLRTLSAVPISVGGVLLISAAAFHALWHRSTVSKQPVEKAEAHPELWKPVERQLGIFKKYAPDKTYWSFEHEGTFYLLQKQDGVVNKHRFATQDERDRHIGSGYSDVMETSRDAAEQHRAQLAMTQAPPNSYLRTEYGGKHILYVETESEITAAISTHSINAHVYRYKFGVEAKLLELDGYQDCEQLEGVVALKSVASELGCGFSPSVRYGGFKTADEDQQALHKLALEIESELFLKQGALLGMPVTEEGKWRRKCTEYLKAFWKVYNGQLERSAISSLLQYQGVVRNVVLPELAGFSDVAMSTLIPVGEKNNMNQLIVVIAAGWKIGVGRAIADAIGKKSV